MLFFPLQLFMFEDITFIITVMNHGQCGMSLLTTVGNKDGYISSL